MRVRVAIKILLYRAASDSARQETRQVSTRLKYVYFITVKLATCKNGKRTVEGYFDRSEVPEQSIRDENKPRKKIELCIRVTTESSVVIYGRHWVGPVVIRRSEEPIGLSSARRKPNTKWPRGRLANGKRRDGDDWWLRRWTRMGDWPAKSQTLRKETVLSAAPEIKRALLLKEQKKKNKPKKLVRL